MEEDTSVYVNNKTTLLHTNTAGIGEKDATDETEAEMTSPSAAIKHGMLGSCRGFCRKSPLTFTLSTAFCFLTQINMVVFIASQITFLEKEFGFTSSQSGRIFSAAQIGSLCLVLPSGYLASRLHVPRVIALTSFLFGVASVMAGLPRFLFAPSSSGVDSLRNSSAAVVDAASIAPAFCWPEDGGKEEEEGRCGAVRALRNGTSDTEVAYNQQAYPVYVFLIVCQVIRGAMGATVFPMFSTYLDANTKKTDAGFYMGIVSAIAILGPAVAFIGGGAISKIHVSLKPTDLTPSHPDWIGAWWLGFLLFGALAAVAPIFVCQFPRRLSPPKPRPSLSPSLNSSPTFQAESPLCLPEDEEESESHGLGRGSVRSEQGKSCFVLMRKGVCELRGFLLSMARLLMNPVYMLLAASCCFMGFSMNGTYLFLPKYMQDQFQIPIWKANFIMGGSELSMGTTGFLVGGWITKRFKLTRDKVYKQMLGTTSISLLMVVIMMLLGCPQATLIGRPGQTEVSQNCSDSCACPEEVFPVCDRVSGESFFSPCHAGCSDLVEGVYVNCSCTASGQAHPGECISECSSVYYYSAVFYSFILFLSASGPVSFLLVVRSLSSSQTGLGIGLNSFVSGIVSFLVGPMVFGGLIDSFCEHWKTPCGVRGQCSVYDKGRFRLEMHLYSIVSMALSVLCVLLSYLICRCCPAFSQPDGGDPDKSHKGDEDVDKIALKELQQSSSAPLQSEDVKLANHSLREVCDDSLPVAKNEKNGQGERVHGGSIPNDEKRL